MEITEAHRTSSRNITSALLNFLLYIGSVNDRTVVNPPNYAKRLENLTNPKKRRRLEKELQNQTMFRYTYIGKSYESRLEESGSTTTGELDHRVIVRGHWRHQWIGKQRDDEGNRIPGTSQKLIWVEPYWKGPDIRDDKVSVRVVRSMLMKYNTVLSERHVQDVNNNLTNVYVKFLNSINWEDGLLVAGLREGRNKFLSNCYIHLFPGINKYFLGHYYSKAALRRVRNGELKHLVFEHVIPKQKYIQSPCEHAAREGRLIKESVLDLLNRYWIIAIVTSEEDKKLKGIPRNWDGKDVFIRYRDAEIDLVTPQGERESV